MSHEKSCLPEEDEADPLAPKILQKIPQFIIEAFLLVHSQRWISCTTDLSRIPCPRRAHLDAGRHHEVITPSGVKCIKRKHTWKFWNPMIDILEFAGNILAKRTKPKIRVEGRTMIIFYTETLRIIDKHINTIINQKTNPRDSLDIYLGLVFSATSSTEPGLEKERIDRAPIIQSQRSYLADDLRHLVLQTLLQAKGEDKKLLKTYHSVLHLLSLMSCKNLSYYSILNEWLNVNSKLEDDEIQLHAMRGNFGKVVEAYPCMREAVETYLELEKRCREECPSAEEFSILVSEWKSRHGSEIPRNLKDIFYGRLKEGDENWIEYLCYRLIYIDRSRGRFTGRKDGIADLIKGDDEIALILMEDYDALVSSSSGWLKLALSFLCSHSQRNAHVAAFESVARSLYSLDWHLCLEYFSYTRKLGIYFSHVTKTVALNPLDLESLVRYSKRNSLCEGELLVRFCSDALENGEYDLLLRTMLRYQFYALELSGEFIRHCIAHFEEVSSEAQFLGTPVGKFIRSYQALALDLALTDEEIIGCLESRYFGMFKNELLASILSRANVSEYILYKCLGIVLELEKGSSGGLLRDYKSIIFERFNRRISPSGGGQLKF
jgi:hypothetical protein